MISDFFLSAFPIVILRKVQISFRSKVGLCLLMGLGVITGALSIVRTILNGQNEPPDPTWDSIPNWYVRTWEVFFGIAAACIPTLSPGYKWLAARVRAGFTKLSGGSDKSAMTSSTSKKWTPPKPSAFLRNTLKRDTTISTAKTCDEDSLSLPLQHLSQNLPSKPSIRSNIERYPSGDQEPVRYPRDKYGNERKAGLHIPGDLSTHRPGHFKRLDSEAKIGGGHGAEEVEERL